MDNIEKVALLVKLENEENYRIAIIDVHEQIAVMRCIIPPMKVGRELENIKEEIEELEKIIVDHLSKIIEEK